MREFLSDSDRDKILRATAELCLEVGYLELEVDQIAARAGVSLACFEENFDGKEAAAQGAIEAVLATVVEIMGRLFSPDRSEVESYLVGIRAILDLMAREPAFAHISYTAARQLMPQTLKKPLDSGSELLASMLDRLRDASTTTGQPPLAARAALGGAEAVVRREIALGRTAELPRLLSDFIYAAAVPFLGQREALLFVRQASQI